MLSAYGLKFELYSSLLFKDSRYWAALSPVAQRFNSYNGTHIRSKKGQYIVIEESTGQHFLVNPEWFEKYYKRNTTLSQLPSPALEEGLTRV